MPEFVEYETFKAQENYGFKLAYVLELYLY